MLRLYSYFRSSATYRVRIALNLKGIDYETLPVHLARGEQYGEDYLRHNAAGLVPTLEIDRSTFVPQSLAIMEYLEERYPDPPLLPKDLLARARVRAIAQSIACDIHPINNLRVLKYLTNTLGVSEEAKNNWYRHWVEEGLAAVESMLANSVDTGKMCHGDTPTFADCCLVPQVFNAQRFDCRLDHVPTVMRIVEHCMSWSAFEHAAPANQPDAR